MNVQPVHQNAGEIEKVAETSAGEALRSDYSPPLDAQRTLAIIRASAGSPNQIEENSIQHLTD
jgi:hypothetical protein